MNRSARRNASKPPPADDIVSYPPPEPTSQLFVDHPKENPMMRTPLRLTATSIAAACLIGTAAGATAAPPATPGPAPVATDAGTGSAMVDSGSAAAQSAVETVQRGDIIGIIVLLALTPFQMLTGGVCDLATFSALPNPCAPSTY